MDIPSLLDFLKSTLYYSGVIEQTLVNAIFTIYKSFQHLDLSRNHSTSSSNCSDLSSLASPRSDEEGVASSTESFVQGRRNRTIFTKKQASELERVFQMTHYPDLKCRHEISKVTKLSENRIQVIFNFFLIFHLLFWT